MQGNAILKELHYTEDVETQHHMYVFCATATQLTQTVQVEALKDAVDMEDEEDEDDDQDEEDDEEGKDEGKDEGAEESDDEDEDEDSDNEEESFSESKLAGVTTV